MLRVESFRLRNEISKRRHPGQTSEILWNLLPLHLITVWQWHSYQRKETGNGGMIYSKRRGFPRFKSQVSSSQIFFFFMWRVWILKFLVPHMKHFPNYFWLADTYAKKYYAQSMFFQKYLGNTFLDDNELIHIKSLKKK